MTDTRREKLADAIAAVEGGDASRMELLRRMQEMQVRRQMEEVLRGKQGAINRQNLPYISDPNAPPPPAATLPYTEGSASPATPLPAVSAEEEAVAKLMRRLRGPVKLQEQMR